MTPTETVALVALIANGWPAMRLEPGTADVWHGALVNVEFDDAREAVTALVATSRWPALSDLIDTAREIREHRHRAAERQRIQASRDRTEELRQLTAGLNDSFGIAHGLPARRGRPDQYTPAGHHRTRNALAVTCPFCRAKPGQVCVNDATGKPLKAAIHPSRTDTANSPAEHSGVS